MAEQWFTPASARRTLASVRPAAERMCRLVRCLEAIRPPAIRPDQLVDRDYFFLVHRLRATLDELERSGVRVSDLRRGLVDFPARRAGREVLLCWRVGEARLAFWHEPDAGYAGRRPVDEDGPWE